jgi:hypothetical protein
MEKQVHKVKERIFDTRKIVYHVANVLENQRYQCQPQTRTHQNLHIVSVFCVDRLATEVLARYVEHRHRTHNQHRKPIKVPSFVLSIVLSVVLYLQLNPKSRLSAKVIAYQLFLTVLQNEVIRLCFWNTHSF